MAALFPPWTNTAMRLALIVAVLAVIGVPALIMARVRSPAVTGQYERVVQPVEFDHRHHVNDDGIACLYCHDNAERGASAGIPPTERCMGCHSQVWNDSPLLDPVRRAFFTGQPLRWRRVHNLPDFVYFDHSIHVSAGFACQSCHGDVAGMAAVYQVAPLTMGWCLGCHRRRSGPTHCSACHR